MTYKRKRYKFYQIDKVINGNYVLTSGKDISKSSNYAFGKGLGGNGTNITDRVKVRISMTAMGVTLNPTEDDIKVKEYGHIDGPVRVIVHTKNTITVLGIPVVSTEQDTIYYYTYAEFPFAAKFPIKPTAFHATVIDDFRNCAGWKFYSSTNLAGLVIDGKMDDSDKSLNLSPWKWSVLTNEKLAFWSRCISPAASTVKVNLYYNDNASAVDKHENIKGELPVSDLILKKDGLI